MLKITKVELHIDNTLEIMKHNVLKTIALFTIKANWEPQLASTAQVHRRIVQCIV